MQRIVTAAEMASIDRKTIDEIGIPGMVLMELAGTGISDEIEAIFDYDVRDINILIFCGKGNNGGDGFVIARHLIIAGANVVIFLAGKKQDLKGDALANFGILEKMNIPVKEISSLTDINHPPQIDLVVDALLGTGVTGPVRGFYAELIQYINHLDTLVVAVDLPTGMETDSGNVVGDCVQADTTLTMAHIKRGLLFSPAREYAGDIVVVDIGVPPAVSAALHGNVFLVEKDDVKQRLPHRHRDAHKTDCGKVVVFAGSVGMTGAATLTSISTLQAGAGLTKLGIPESLNPIMEQKLTEVMTVPLPETSDKSISIRAKDIIGDLIDWADVLAIGPGLSTNSETVEFVRWLLTHVSKPMVIDADGLNALANAVPLIKNYKNELILTPHPGELSRLLSCSPQEISNNRIEMLKKTAQEFGCVIVLKGGPTLTAAPDGSIYINSTGNPGMATGGSGDVLTGIIAGLWAQKLSALDAAMCGVYVHGLAGDLAAAALTEMSMIAGDINLFLPEAIKNIQE